MQEAEGRKEEKGERVKKVGGRRNYRNLPSCQELGGLNNPRVASLLSSGDLFSVPDGVQQGRRRSWQPFP